MGTEENQPGDSFRTGFGGDTGGGSGVFSRTSGKGSTTGSGTLSSDSCRLDFFFDSDLDLLFTLGGE